MVFQDEQFELPDGTSVVCSSYTGKHRPYYGNGSPRLGELKVKGILRNNNYASMNTHLSTSLATRQYSDESSATPSARCSCLESVLRPCIAEFLSVFFCLFPYLVTDAELLDRHVVFYNRILTVAAVDAITALVFVTAFQTVHISPAITIAQLFSLSTAWPLCLIMLIMQLLASVTAVFFFALLRSDAALPSVNVLHDTDADGTRAAFRLVLIECVGSMMVVMSQLMTSTKVGYGLTAIGRTSLSPLPLFAAILLSSFLSLLLSTVSWNPLLAFGLTVYSAVQNDYSAFLKHYIFWLGPIIGSLFGCFLFRLVFAPEEKRLTHCSGCCSKSDVEII